jgi:hypothetical protein
VATPSATVTVDHSIAILIPVLGRPERAAPLVRSIRMSTDVPYQIVFLCSPNDHDAISAYSREVGGVIVVGWEPGPGDFARKTNLGFAETTEPFVFCGATDLTFQPGWDVAALKVADETSAGVIGTWDGANPAVMHGKHSTHPLVRRSYAENLGCTIDGTGAIYSEAYDHQCVDNELIETAQSRGEWAFAAESRVLHHHPFYDRTMRIDATYKKALAHGKEDKILFMRRRRLWQHELRARQRLARRSR